MTSELVKFASPTELLRCVPKPTQTWKAVPPVKRWGLMSPWITIGRHQTIKPHQNKKEGTSYPRSWCLIETLSVGLPSAHSAPHRRPRVSDHDMQKCYLDWGQAHSPTKFSPQSPSITRNSQRQKPGKTLPVFNIKTSMTFGKFQVFAFKASKYHMLKSPMNQSLVKMPSPMKHLLCENCSIYYGDTCCCCF